MPVHAAVTPYNHHLAADVLDAFDRELGGVTPVEALRRLTTFGEEEVVRRHMVLLELRRRAELALGILTPLLAIVGVQPAGDLISAPDMSEATRMAAEEVERCNRANGEGKEPQQE